jgi:hypothetical protein
VDLGSTPHYANLKIFKGRRAGGIYRPKKVMKEKER